MVALSGNAFEQNQTQADGTSSQSVSTKVSNEDASTSLNSNDIDGVMSSLSRSVEEPLQHLWHVAPRRRKIGKNAARERSRVQQLKKAFVDLQNALPNVPSGTKLSKLDILLLATNYISYLMNKLSDGQIDNQISRSKCKGALHPMKKWPMRSRLFMDDTRWLYRSQTSDHKKRRKPSTSLAAPYQHMASSFDLAGLTSTQQQQINPLHIICNDSTDDVDFLDQSYVAPFSSVESSCMYGHAWKSNSLLSISLDRALHQGRSDDEERFDCLPSMYKALDGHAGRQFALNEYQNFIE